MKVVSFFSGCGGLDLGFAQAGFEVIWANEFDRTIHDTYRLNHPNTYLCTDNIYNVEVESIPDCDGFIGGPPCQAWSVGGKSKGIEDDRGKLFLYYVKLIERKKPKFFVIENVFGMLTEKHFPVFLSFIRILEKAEYKVWYEQLNAANFGVPQDRKRVIIIGILNQLNIDFVFPSSKSDIIPLSMAIGDLKANPYYYTEGQTVGTHPLIPNHDVYIGEYDRKFMARNRVRSWTELSFTIQAQAKNCPLHPQAPKMRYIGEDKRIFEPGYEYLYRRLSVRECARIQTFPDRFKFIYTDIRDGYKMVGNAVPPRMAKEIAISIKQAFASIRTTYNVLVAYFKNYAQLEKCKKKNLFYIRASISCQVIVEGNPLPKFLLLIKGKEKRLFRIKENSKPILIEKKDLEVMGFDPNHKFYWVIEMEDEINIGLKDYVAKWKNPRDRHPYYDNITI